VTRQASAGPASPSEAVASPSVPTYHKGHHTTHTHVQQNTSNYACTHHTEDECMLLTQRSSMQSQSFDNNIPCCCCCCCCRQFSGVPGDRRAAEMGLCCW